MNDEIKPILEPAVAASCLKKKSQQAQWAVDSATAQRVSSTPN